MSRKDSWVPAFAGMTEQGTLSTVSFAGMTEQASLSIVSPLVGRSCLEKVDYPSEAAGLGSPGSAFSMTWIVLPRLVRC